MTAQELIQIATTLAPLVEKVIHLRASNPDYTEADAQAALAADADALAAKIAADRAAHPQPPQ